MTYRRKVTWTIVIFMLCTLGHGCRPKPEDIVRQYRLEIDPSVTIGEALNSYSYFGHTGWTSFKDAQQQDIVEFKGIMDYDRFVGSAYLGVQLTPEMVFKGKKMLGDLITTYIIRFVLAKDLKTFTLKYSALHLAGTNRQTGDYVEQDIADKDFHVFQFIYLNSPEPSTYTALLSATI